MTLEDRISSLPDCSSIYAVSETVRKWKKSQAEWLKKIPTQNRIDCHIDTAFEINEEQETLAIDRTKIKPGDVIWSEKIVPNDRLDYFLNKHEKIVKVFPVVKQELEKYCSCLNPERWSDRDNCIKCGLTIKSLTPGPAFPGRINIECWSAGSCEEILRCKINEILGYLQKEKT